MSRRVLRGGDWAAEALAQLPYDTGAGLQVHGRLLKRDQHSVVALGELQGETCYLKFYAAKNLLQRGLFALGRGRAIDAYDAAAALTQAGIAVPLAKACLLLGDGLLLATEGMPDAQDLKAVWVQGAPAALRQQMLQAAGETLAALHGAGFAHGDCKWSNLLWEQNRFFLVDLEAVVRCPKGDRRQARDLARFTLNAEDLGVEPRAYQHFLDAYSGCSSISSADLVEQMRGDLTRLRARHREKYGERGARLI